MSENKYTPGVWVAGFLGIAAMTCALLVLHGFVFSVLWGWFAAPLFGLPAITIPQAIGLSLVLSASRIAVKSQESDGWTMWLSPFLALAIGWVVKSFL